MNIKNWWGWLDVIQTKQLHWGRGFHGLVHLWTPLAKVCSKGLFYFYIFITDHFFWIWRPTFWYLDFEIFGFIIQKVMKRHRIQNDFVKKFTTKLRYKMFKLLYDFAVCYFSAGKYIIFIYCTWVFFGYAWCTFIKINMYTW